MAEEIAMNAKVHGPRFAMRWRRARGPQNRRSVSAAIGGAWTRSGFSCGSMRRARRFLKSEIRNRNPKNPQEPIQDWFTEYNDYILNSARGRWTREAIEHINHYGSAHSDSIVNGQRDARKTVPPRSFDSATVYWNASTASPRRRIRRWGRNRHQHGQNRSAGSNGIGELTSYKWHWDWEWANKEMKPRKGGDSLSPYILSKRVSHRGNSCPRPFLATTGETPVSIREKSYTSPNITARLLHELHSLCSSHGFSKFPDEATTEEGRWVSSSASYIRPFLGNCGILGP